MNVSCVYMQTQTSSTLSPVLTLKLAWSWAAGSSSHTADKWLFSQCFYTCMTLSAHSQMCLLKFKMVSLRFNPTSFAELCFKVNHWAFLACNERKVYLLLKEDSSVSIVDTKCCISLVRKTPVLPFEFHFLGFVTCLHIFVLCLVFKWLTVILISVCQKRNLIFWKLLLPVNLLILPPSWEVWYHSQSVHWSYS